MLKNISVKPSVSVIDGFITEKLVITNIVVTIHMRKFVIVNIRDGEKSSFKYTLRWK